ncbi:MAG TPA: (2Fe-2S)-binding protein [Candidatus Tectomicrobia bacterium]|nr:(2Fe-2S)-binding protein [Candidatus Tectomicrobia bacterium]
MPQQLAIRLTVNGLPVEETVSSRLLLSDFLRDTVGLTGVRVCCEQGICGACTILVDGQTARACLLLAVQADGADILTVEGLARPGTFHPLQQAFWDHHGLQCGYCTPGILITAYELLTHNPTPSETEVRQAIAGNICRCTGYVHIVDSILAAARSMRRGGAP